MFISMCSRSWAGQYFTDENGISIAISIPHEQARQELKEAGFEGILDSCTFIDPAPGEYEETSDPPDRPSVPETEFVMKPGEPIRSCHSQQVALYSGSIGVSAMRQVGMTVGHMFKSEADVHVTTNQYPIRNIGRRLLTLENIFTRPMSGMWTNHS